MKKIRFNKKGMFFTLLAMVIISFMMISISFKSDTKFSEKNYAINIRVSTLNDFIKDINMDMERALYIMSFRSILSIEQYIIANGTFVTNITESFKSALLNGTVEGSVMDIMEDSTIYDWIYRMQTEGNKIDAKINITIKLIESSIALLLLNSFISTLHIPSL